MDITKIGHSSFKLRGKKATVITDPFDPKYVGIKYSKQKADIITISHQHQDHNYTDLIEENPFVIYAPGEYEIGGVRIIGVKSFHDDLEGKERGVNTIYHYEIDGLNIVHCGDLGHVLNDKIIDVLDGIDVLLIPIGGEYTINTKEALEMIKKIEPSIVIPMHYLCQELNTQIFAKLSSIQEFLKEFSEDKIQKGNKLTVSRETLPVETTVFDFI